jgi:hypothetical protein
VTTASGGTLGDADNPLSDPTLSGLLQKLLPPIGEPFPAAQRRQLFTALAVNLDVVEPPWGVEPQTYALRVDLQVSASAAVDESECSIHTSGRGAGAARLQFVDRFVDKLLSSDAGLTGARRVGQWSPLGGGAHGAGAGSAAMTSREALRPVRHRADGA